MELYDASKFAALKRDVPKSKVSQSARAPIQKLLLLKRLFVRESSRTCSFVLKSSTEGPPRESGTISPAPQSPVRRHPRSCKSTRSAARWAGHSWGYVGWAGHSRGSARACRRLPKTARQPLPCPAWGARLPPASICYHPTTTPTPTLRGIPRMPGGRQSCLFLAHATHKNSWRSPQR